MRANDPAIPVDDTLLMTMVEDTLRRMITLLSYQMAWDGVHGQRADESQPDDQDLLGALLVENEQQALERACRILQVLDPGEDFDTIHSALRADAAESRASARELIGHVLGGGCRDALLALTDALPPAERLEAANKAMPVPLAQRTLDAWRAAHTPHEGGEPEAVLAAIVDELGGDDNVVLAAVARYQARRQGATPPEVTEGARAAG